jgi:ABC-2 type transport system ATP-binding protein
VIYIKDGVLEKSENLQDITNQYSEDNLDTYEATKAVLKTEKKEKAKVWIERKSSSVLSHSNDTFDFEVYHELYDENLKKEELYIAYSLHDEKRGGVVFDSGPIESNGDVVSVSIPMSNFHNTEFKIIASLRQKPRITNPDYPERTEMITFTKEGSDVHFIYRNIDDKRDYALLRELT